MRVAARLRRDTSDAASTASASADVSCRSSARCSVISARLSCCRAAEIFRHHECCATAGETRIMSGETFETLLAPTLGGVRRLVNRRLKNSCHAEDVIQEILLRAFARRDQLRVDERFGGWLWSIAVNAIREFFRRDRRILSLDEFPNFDARDTTASPLARFEKAERRSWVRECIAALPQRDQIVIHLRDIDGKSIREVAGAIGMSQAATKSVHFRARKRLARVIRARRPGRIPVRRGLKEIVEKENRIA
ncbi:MAG: hypothetical protein C5B51_30940 [Terriglobia bacterium]|nr:MAG: hypothetical protein C5B51_30940 [Terriglobia bacterium]